VVLSRLNQKMQAGVELVAKEPSLPCHIGAIFPFWMASSAGRPGERLKKNPFVLGYNFRPLEVRLQEGRSYSSTLQSWAPLWSELERFDILNSFKRKKLKKFVLRQLRYQQHLATNSSWHRFRMSAAMDLCVHAKTYTTYIGLLYHCEASYILLRRPWQRIYKSDHFELSRTELESHTSRASVVSFCYRYLSFRRTCFETISFTTTKGPGLYRTNIRRSRLGWLS